MSDGMENRVVPLLAGGVIPASVMPPGSLSRFFSYMLGR